MRYRCKEKFVCLAYMYVCMYKVVLATSSFCKTRWRRWWRPTLQITSGVAKGGLGKTNLIKHLDFDQIERHFVKLLPREFNGDIIFKLRPMLYTSTCFMNMFVGMDNCYDGHVWTITKTNNIKKQPQTHLSVCHMCGSYGVWQQF